MVEAYAAGLGHHAPSTKRRLVGTPSTPEKSIGGGRKDEGDGTTTAVSAGGAAAAAAARDLWSDDGRGGRASSSNHLAMGPVARKALFLSLQAGSVAHLSLKERRAAEVPWIQVSRCWVEDTLAEGKERREGGRGRRGGRLYEDQIGREGRGGGGVKG